MENPDILGLDGHQLRLLLAISQYGSLSSAARMLDLNQSTVSYHLENLRRRLDDPLFVRAGNGMKETERARQLMPIAQSILSALETLGEREAYDPATDKSTLRIAGASIDRDAVISKLLQFSMSAAPQMSIEFIALRSFHEEFERLSSGVVDIVIMPERSAEVDGLMRRPLFEFQDTVFFDQAFPLVEGDWDAFCARPQARVALGAEPGFGVDRRLAALGRSRHVALQVHSFDSALRLIPGTPIIATLPKVLHLLGPDLGHVAPPWDVSPIRMMLYWHVRTQRSARHMFWRDQLANMAKGETLNRS